MINTSARGTGLSPVRLALAAAVIAVAFGAPGTAFADALVAKVNGVEIFESDLALIEEGVGGNLPSATPEQRREALINYATDIVMLAKAAEAKNLQDSPEFKKKLAHLRQRLLMEEMMEQAGREAVKTADLQKIYEETSKTLSQEQEVRARHILVESEDLAKELVKQARTGTDFVELVKKNTKDTGSSEDGDLGYFTKSQMVPEFAEVAFKTAKGQIADPVKTQFGWHVIKVEDIRQRQAPKLEEVREQIEQYVQHKAQTELVLKLRESAKIERVQAPEKTPDPKAPEQKAPDQKK
ncbi:peptidylprolyl isomerase [Blastochloris viridis]|uniref:Parvulin-like PPIase n=1 Tax=Blastochloris viridis TaxID=1079 RepID=A0A0H5B8U9_BLAVI|nr:peptidylprolyl isomerase [Blastochloris viridis]ALK08102.1 putative parvulin-type peptidyl-prolyl cis-trans isomerase precursor [Blastochloris viridis]BAR98635.1 Foldase protein PrsA precursor [Blastochloris viridis]CUU44024.1 Foldase protein prsA 1 precursor [Blastochloris viridis]